MRGLPKPTADIKDSIILCGKGIKKDTALVLKLFNSTRHLISAQKTYCDAASLSTLYSIYPVGPFSSNRPTLSGEDLTKIYRQYFVSANKPARLIYDSIMNSSKEKCPFCGGLGTPKTLDHFLPKEKFPEFAILPQNLIPSCRDCNMGEKKENVASGFEDQILHPYFEKSHIFSEQWIFATYTPGNRNQPGIISYFADPPVHWQAEDKSKVINHFTIFNLANRYSLRSASQLPIILLQITKLRERGISDETIIHTVIETGIECAESINNWQTGFYQAISNALPLL